MTAMSPTPSKKPKSFLVTAQADAAYKRVVSRLAEAGLHWRGKLLNQQGGFEAIMLWLDKLDQTGELAMIEGVREAAKRLGTSGATLGSA